MRKRLRAVWGLIIVGVVAACALGPVPEMRESLYPEMPNQSPLIGSSPTATESDSSVTPFAPPSATLLPSLTPTARPYVVAVATGIYAESMELWTDIEARVDRCIVIMEDGSDNQARLLWTWQTEPNDTVLGAEPHLWVSHHDANVSDVTWPALGEMAESGWTLLAPDGCSSLLSERLPDVSVDTSLLSADAAHRAARDRRALALVPWRAVGVEMRTLPFDGERFDPRDTTAWPILRSLVLRGKEPPEGLVQALGELAPASFPGVELVGVGDIMLARSVGDEIAIQGACYPYGGEGIADLLQGADVAFGNLECVVSTGGVRQNKAYTFRANPATLEGLAWAGFDVVALANNHTCDYGRDAVVDTVSNVVEAGILAAGAGENLDRARQAQFLEVNGLTLAFLAYNHIGPRWMDATAERAGSAYMDPAIMLEDVHSASEHADLVIVACHWGVEHATYTTAFQRDLSAKLWAAGADLILGHHPHVMQAIAVEGCQATVYSMGNFVFDMGTAGSLDGYAVRCWLDETGCKQIELLPYHIDGYRPSLLECADRDNAVARIHTLTTQAGGWPK